MNENEEIQKLWHELGEQPFPRGSRAKDLTIDLAGCDAYASGCLRAFIENGALDARRVWVLRNCLGSLLDLRARCTEKDRADKAYIARLLEISKKVLNAAREQAN